MDELFQEIITQISGYKSDIITVVLILLTISLVMMAYRGLQNLIDTEYQSNNDEDDDEDDEDDTFQKEWKQIK